MRSASLLALALLGACTAPQAAHPASSMQSSARASRAVCDAYRAQNRGVELTASGTVVRVLGVRQGRSGVHEGFLVATDPAAGCRITLRVEHNVDIARRVPLQRGEPVEIRGEYIYDPRGGIMHWTHHDPRGRHPGGYVRANGELYE